MFAAIVLIGIKNEPVKDQLTVIEVKPNEIIFVIPLRT